MSQNIRSMNWKQLTKRRVLGLVVMALGVMVLFLPIFVGEWVISLLGILMMVAGLFQFIETLRSTDETTSYLSYSAGIVTVLLGLLLFMSPNLVLSGLLVALTLFFLVDGGIKIYGAYKQTGAERWWDLFNGLFAIALGLLLWFLVSANLGLAAIGIILGLRLIAQGWTMFFVPEKAGEAELVEPDPRQHPDAHLGLDPSDTIKVMQEPILQKESIVTGQNIFWGLTLLAILFAIHLFRVDAERSLLGLITPFSATVGDAALALLIAVVLLLPIRLLWRAASRPIERAAWNRFDHLNQNNLEPTLAERALKFWLERRLTFAIEINTIRSSLGYAFWRILRIGLPLTAIIVAINSIWGFSWYFNSENWASAVWQAITQERVDVWREAMAEDVEQNALAKGIAPDKVFAIEPEGVSDTGDFSFVVIGDTGEGDASQFSLHDQIIAAGKREAVKFLILSSDVIYPDGKMKDYEKNFYLPFKGFEKPFYAIPGNHDWFDADQGFNANFLEPEAAILSLRARLAADLGTEAITTDQRFAEMTAEAQRLRDYYGIKNGRQRAPFFEMHTADFSLITVDTGILRRLDEKEMAWFEAALERAGDNFKMVVIGHPLYAAGINQSETDPDFNAIHDIMRRYKVDISMGGDTHDFEFYRENYVADGNETQMLHFVNGGGGAYLSIGTALAFPSPPATEDYAFYPRTDELNLKITSEAPWWKKPVIFWLNWFNGYPVTPETLSGVFDFNGAPFFQSFMEIKVERSQNQVRLLLYGVNGQLRWRDLQIGGQVKPADKSDDDFVEFIVPLHE
ncbi:MAG: DUF308 domain-containing protein [Anaerolineae bacterium]|nr:DUF308 domain-containing protein [Anaerolineae bacterium]